MKAGNHFSKSFFIIPIIMAVIALQIDAPIKPSFEEKRFLYPKLTVTKPFTNEDLNDSSFCKILTIASFEPKFAGDDKKINQKYLENELQTNDKIRRAHLFEEEILKNKIERVNNIRKKIQLELKH